jgi:hypothetical protein
MGHQKMHNSPKIIFQNRQQKIHIFIYQTRENSAKKSNFDQKIEGEMGNRPQHRSEN